jgi:hypothetical protein
VITCNAGICLPRVMWMRLESREGSKKVNDNVLRNTQTTPTFSVTISFFNDQNKKECNDVKFKYKFLDLILCLLFADKFPRAMDTVSTVVLYE